MLNKKAGVADLVSLFTATIIIVMILIGFVVVSGIVKAFDKAENGEKIYDDGDVGVGNVKEYMINYERFVRAEGMIRKGESVDGALASVDYKRALVLLELDEIPDVALNLVWGVLYG